MQSLNASLISCLDGCIGIFNQFLPGALGEDVFVEGRQLRIIRILGEGGYSFVYLVREISTDEHASAAPTHFALKKVLAGSNEQLVAAQKEVEVMSQLHHPNLLPLLCHTTVDTYNNGRLLQLVYMLFPVYEEGTLLDEVTRRQQQQNPLTPAEILHIFLQICCAVQAMHDCKPPLAHRDIKPHNVLLQRHKHPQQEANSSLPDDDQESQALHAVGAAPTGSSYHAVLMDFGSCQPARFKVLNRSQALAVQEDAEAHCTAPYKAPELFDVPSECDLDERVDIWSLGCLLYYMMYGVSPFERMLNEAGGSLALAVINNRPTWPGLQKPMQPLQELILYCLDSDPQHRPYVDDVISRAKTMQQTVVL